MTLYLFVGLIIWLVSLYPTYRYTANNPTPTGGLITDFLSLALGLLVLLPLAWPLVLIIYALVFIKKVFKKREDDVQ